jgi:hypothetical protein
MQNPGGSLRAANVLSDARSSSVAVTRDNSGSVILQSSTVAKKRRYIHRTLSCVLSLEWPVSPSSCRDFLTTQNEPSFTQLVQIFLDSQASSNHPKSSGHY